MALFLVVYWKKFDILKLTTKQGGFVMGFVKLIKKFKGCKKPLGAILIVDDAEVREGVTQDVDGNEYPTSYLAPLTEEEASKYLRVEKIEL